MLFRCLRFSRGSGTHARPLAALICARRFWEEVSDGSARCKLCTGAAMGDDGIWECSICRSCYHEGCRHASAASEGALTTGAPGSL